MNWRRTTKLCHPENGDSLVKEFVGAGAKRLAELHLSTIIVAFFAFKYAGAKQQRNECRKIENLRIIGCSDASRRSPCRHSLLT